MSWLAQYFLNPAFVLPGAALASLPILIHLLSRLRYRRLRFAAMEFLLESDEQNRRRLILEQLLLLLLRVLAVALIVLLLARLVLDPSGMLLMRGATAHHVLILDDTLSMQDQDEHAPVYQKAVEILERMLSAGGYRNSSVRVSVLTMTEPDRPLISDQTLDAALLQEAIPRLRNHRCAWTSAAPVRALEAATNILSADGGVAPAVHVITDFRRTDWSGRPEVEAALEELGAVGATVNVVRAVEETRPNLAIIRFSGATTATAVGVAWRVTAEIRNHSDQRVSGQRATLLVDGVELPGRILLPDLEAHQEDTVYHDLSFDAPGRHQVEIRLEEDALPADNRRLLAVQVAHRRQVLIVDDQGQQEDAGFVAAALSPDPALTGIVADVHTSDVLTSTPLEAWDCIYLLNVRELPADAVQMLAEYVQAGGGLAWFPDDQANTDWYNTALQSADINLFPVTLGITQQVEAANDTTLEPDFPTPVFEKHPVFAAYEAEDSPFARLTHVTQWFRPTADWVPAEGISVVARLSNGDPLVLEHTSGRGHILTFLTTAGRRWSNWPVAPALPGYVVTHLLMHGYLQQVDHSVQSRVVGETLKFEWSVHSFGDAVELLLPATDQQIGVTADEETLVKLQAVAAEPKGNTAGEQLELIISQADRPGLYRMRRFRTDGDGQETWLALNVPTSESDLAVADAAELQQNPQLEHVKIVSGSTAEELSTADSGRELRWMLLAGLIGVLVAEQLLSLRMSFHPEVTT